MTLNAAVRVIQGPLAVEGELGELALVFDCGSIRVVRPPSTVIETLRQLPVVLKGAVTAVPFPLAVEVPLGEFAFIAAAGIFAILGTHEHPSTVIETLRQLPVVLKGAVEAVAFPLAVIFAPDKVSLVLKGAVGAVPLSLAVWSTFNKFALVATADKFVIEIRQPPTTVIVTLLPFPFVLKGAVRAVPPSSAVFMAVSIVVAKEFLESGTFWQFFGTFRLGVATIMLWAFALPDVRGEFGMVLRSRRFMGMVIAAELLVSVSLILRNGAINLGPVSLVAAVSSIQPTMVFLYSLALATFVPSRFGHWIAFKTIKPQVAGIGAITAGVVIISLQ